MQKNAENINEFELAKSTFFLNRTNISGVIKGGIIGGIKQTGKYKIDSRFNKVDLIRRIQKIKNVKNRISVSNYDGIDFVKSLDKKKEEIFIYLDPPYLQKGSDLYMNFYSKDDHRKLSELVRQLSKKWIVSYDNHEFILNLYAEQRKIIHNLSQAASNRIGNEIFVFSDHIYFTNSINMLRSPTVC